MDLKELYKKITSLKDLRAAIKEVKSVNKSDKKEQHRQEAKESLAGQSTLKHLGMKQDITPGVMTHMVGIPGSNWHYEIDANFHHSANDKPAYSVKFMGPQGKVQSRSNQVHDSIGSAVGDLVHHMHNSTWKK